MCKGIKPLLSSPLLNNPHVISARFYRFSSKLLKTNQDFIIFVLIMKIFSSFQFQLCCSRDFYGLYLNWVLVVSVFYISTLMVLLQVLSLSLFVDWWWAIHLSVLSTV
ncbi:hypothetical protein HS088_TW22G00369 [Tripterygium wilfordii]|uniref:Uncharacterized protein n=1 Tax=Tripterygium wilfordii TaxID=458696 RepID=A0A7J7BXZ3_TRIWF|nr:hypothetical protein HS088_TW22G00369 [Tripterygium wilfordii]